MSTSPLVFDVQAKTAGAVAGFKRLASSILPVTKEADKAGQSIDKLSSKKVAVKADTTAIAKVKTEIGRLYSEISKAKALDVNADTRKAQQKIRGLQATLRTLSKTSIDPQVKTGWRDKVAGALSSVQEGLGKLGGGISKVFSNVGVPLLGAIGVAAAGAATAIGAVAVKSLMLADAFQRSRVQMNSFIGNMKVTDTLLQNVQRYADTTPFEFPELQSATKRLLGIGTAAKDIPKQLALIGDIAAQSGSNVDDLALIFSQMVSNGRVSAEDMNQLADRGVNAWGALSKATGKSVSDLRQLSSTGKLGADSIQLLWDTLGKGAKGSTDALSKTLSGQLSTLKDTLNGTLRDIGNALLPIVNSIMPGIQKGAEGFGDKIKANLPAIVDIAAAIATAFVNLPGTVLRGLATISQGIASMVSGAQVSLSYLVAGIAVALESLPAIFGKIDTSGLRDAQLNLAQAAIHTNKIGEDTFNGLTTAADKADAATKPIAANIEKARQQAQGGLKLDAETKALDTKIAAAQAKVDKFKANSINPKLKADKSYWDKQLAAAEGDLKKLKGQKANVQFKADTAPLLKKINSASSSIASLGKKKATPEINAKIDAFKRKRAAAIHDLAVLQTKKANPKLDANSAAFKRKVGDAESKLRKVDGKKGTVYLDAHDNASSKIATVDRNRKNLNGKSATVHLNTIHTTYVRKASKGTTAGNGPGAVSVVPPPPVVNVAPPQITLHVRDERLADLIDLRVDGRAVRAAHVVHRRRGVLL